MTTLAALLPGTRGVTVATRDEFTEGASEFKVRNLI